ncbi:hypothetical protein TH63_11500 [Rufibacter radiotolerans]|uniref:Aspartyl protease n=1 Tax=Rufibacter radiotolerans TaxID=1379910 RepID=A0A0H4VQU8_9BACT|nr:PDZ domain-containing protein [Rufibacter radiotolerans]AKQ46114.1 hypothetical protein TH63_11500 [Rufibacter radiotolerans]
MDQPPHTALRTSFFIGCLFLGLILIPALASGQTMPDKEEGLKFEFPRNKVRIPFKLVHNLVIIPIQINNSKPLNFVVDTGVDRTILIELNPYDSIALLDVQSLFLRGLGRGAGIQAILSTGNLIRFSGLEARNQSVLVLEENIFELSSRVGMDVNGIIGFPLFQNFVVEMDYANKIMTLYKPGKYPERKARKSTMVPLTIEDAKPYVNVKAVFPDGQKFPMRLIVDSGMSSCLLLYTPTLPGVKLPDKRIKAFLGRGLNGEIHGEITRIKALELGEYTLKNPPASFPDTVSIRYALSLNNRNGNLGADVLQRFKVVFDYQKSRMLLRPTSKLRDPFVYNLSGLELITPIPGFNFYTVSDVLPDSPAEKAGLRAGDAIISINGEACLEKSFSEVLDLFQNKPGRKLTLKVSRQMKEFNTTLHLQDLI